MFEVNAKCTQCVSILIMSHSHRQPNQRSMVGRFICYVIKIKITKNLLLYNFFVIFIFITYHISHPTIERWFGCR
jgi:hypothetical protein